LPCQARPGHARQSLTVPGHTVLGRALPRNAKPNPAALRPS
jgi:hypothetical protein